MRRANACSLLAELKTCRNLERGKILHSAAIQSGDDADFRIASTLINMYANCGSMENASTVFEKMQYRDAVTWTVLILGYANNGKSVLGLDMFSRMRDEGCAPDARTFVAAFKTCTGLLEVEGLEVSGERGRALHTLAMLSGCDSDIYVGNTLVDMYTKSGRMQEALRVFKGLPHRDIISWNALIFGYAANGEGTLALDLLSRMRSDGCTPDALTIVATLKACCDLPGNIRETRQVLYLLALRSGCGSDVYVEGTLVDMFAKCGNIKEARTVFDRMQYRDVVPWNALILGYAENEERELALDLFSRMRYEGCAPDARTVSAALKACTSVQTIERLHTLAQRLGYASDHFVANTLLDMYAKSGSLETALSVFESMQFHDLVAWNALILGYAEYGEDIVALDLFGKMRLAVNVPDSRTFVAALKACTDLGAGKALHLLALSTGDLNMYLESSLVDMYSKCGSIEDARNIFENMQYRNVVSWNALILGYADNGKGEISLDLLSRMRAEGCETDVITFVGALKACSSIGSHKENSAVLRGKATHLLASISGCDSYSFVESTLVDMYAKCDCMDAAQRVFDMLKCRDVTAWTALILGYAENGEAEMSLSLLWEMHRKGDAPEARTFVAALKACTDLATKEDSAASNERGKALHLLTSWGCASNIYVNSTLVDMYAKLARMEDARRVFDDIRYPDVVAWNALLTGYADNGKGNLVLELFTRMKGDGLEPNAVTYAAVLKACSTLGALEVGRGAHAEVCSLEVEHLLATHLVDFYCKCGCLLEAKQVFDAHGTKDLLSWNALLAGNSRLGNAEDVFELFERMPDSGAQPNAVTLLCVLTACSHAGLVDKGKSYFESMPSRYGVPCEIEHYSCMVDILGRANQLDEAMAMLRSMAFTPSTLIWMTVLGACRKWRNVTLGRLAFTSLTSCDARNAAAYVLMANLYGSRGMWKDQAEVQATRAMLQVCKKPGKSWWTSKEGAMHVFLAGDKTHPQNREMREKLTELLFRMKQHGYVADLSSVTSNISDEEKENALCGHSERLAIACALINTEAGETIRIIKNLRVCNDCHVATALISKLEKRSIVCRDASRFHVFEDGKCSCGDFW